MKKKKPFSGNKRTTVNIHVFYIYLNIFKYTLSTLYSMKKIFFFKHQVKKNFKSTTI